MKKICVLQYGAGNSPSIYNMLRYIGVDASLVSSVGELKDADALIVPGVGSFDHCMKLLKSQAFDQSIIEHANAGKLLVGICVGMQMLGQSSEEGSLGGLGLLNFYSERFKFNQSSHLRIPHVGWNSIVNSEDQPEERYYFTHSYHAKVHDDSLIWKECDYGYRFTAAVKKENIIGVQFHPEKSHRFGIKLFRSIFANEI